LLSTKHHLPCYCQPDVLVTAIAAAPVHEVFISLKFEQHGVSTERRFIRTKVDQNQVFTKGSLNMKKATAPACCSTTAKSADKKMAFITKRHNRNRTKDIQCMRQPYGHYHVAAS